MATRKNGETIIDEAKELLPSFYADGQWIENPELKFNGRQLDSEVIEFLKQILKFLLDGSAISEASKIFIMSPATSVAKAFEKYNNSCEEIDKIENLNTFQAMIQYDKRKMNKYFAERSTLYNIQAYPAKHLENNRNILNRLEREFMDDKIFNRAMAIKLPKDYLSYSIDDMSWVTLTKLLDTYSVKRINMINNLKSSDISIEMVGYYNYLISNNNLSKKDLERLNEIKRILDIE